MSAAGSDDKPRALVTGASRGIGRAIAEALVAAGYEVVGTSRNPRKADPIPGVSWLPLDVASPRSVEGLGRKLGRVDVLVNNAGMGMVGPAEEATDRQFRRMLETNFFGPVRLAQLVASGMRERGSGAIVNIGSMRSEVSTPFFSAYSSAKAALRSWTGALRMELEPFGVRVTLLAPFDVRTTLPLEVVMREGSPYAARIAYARENRDRGISSGVEPKAVANAVVRILLARRAPGFATVGKRAGLMTFLLRHMPRGFIDSVVRRTYDRA